MQSRQDPPGKSFAGQVATSSELSAIATQSSIQKYEMLGNLKQMFIDREEDLAAAQDLNSKTSACRSRR